MEGNLKIGVGSWMNRIWEQGLGFRRVRRLVLVRKWVLVSGLGFDGFGQQRSGCDGG